ncbi:glyoxalase [Thioclava sp. SK-1]|nr:glyoxalase [Thioclava sp. SK-1]
MRALDHIGLTVPDISAATQFFHDVFGAVTLYDVQPADAEPMQGADVEAQLGLSKGSKVLHMRLLRIGDGPCLELFQIDGPSQDAARLQDMGLTHLGLYVDDVDAVVQRFSAAGGRCLAGPHPLSGIEGADGNAGIYGYAPWGTLIELLTYPGGLDYPADAAATRWTPAPSTGGAK